MKFSHQLQYTRVLFLLDHLLLFSENCITYIVGALFTTYLFNYRHTNIPYTCWMLKMLKIKKKKDVTTLDST